MKKLSCLFLLFFLLDILYISGQTMPGTSDSLLMEELKMASYDKDTSAPAVVLSDKGVVQLLAVKNQYDFEKFYSRILKIKVLSLKGLAYGTYPISLYHHNNFGEEISYLSAATYNLENGKIVHTTFAMKELKETLISNQLTEEKISLPNVKIGSVIYISYTIKSPYNVYFNWPFQQAIPTDSSQFSLIIPPFCHYKYLMKNIDINNLFSSVYTDKTDRIIGNQHYQNLIYYYAINHIPAFKDVPFMSAPKDYLMQLAFQIVKWDAKGFTALSGTHYLSTWKEFTDKLLLEYTYFGGYLYSKENYLNKLVIQMGLDKKPEAEKVKVIINYVKSTYCWNKTFDILSDKKMEDFITDKSGNSAAVNLFLTALLKAAGINASPVIISTRGHGKIVANYPSLSFFNDVLCYVKTDSLSLLLDATELTLPYYAIPPQCTNGSGYLVQKNDSSWVDLKPQMTAGIMENLIIKFSPGFDSMRCNFNIKASGYSGYAYRKKWKKGYDTVQTELVNDKGMDLLDSIKAFSLDKPEESFALTYNACRRGSKQTIPNNPAAQITFPSFLNEPILDNPLKSPDRKYPVDMEYPHDFKYNAIVVIPAGYKVDEVPQEVNSSLASGNANFSYKVKYLSDNVIQFTSDLSFNIAIFQPAEYGELRNLYDLAIKTYMAPVSIVKK